MSSQETPETQRQGEALETRGGQGSHSPYLHTHALPPWGGGSLQSHEYPETQQSTKGIRTSHLDTGSTVSSADRLKGGYFSTQLGF